MWGPRACRWTRRASAAGKARRRRRRRRSRTRSRPTEETRATPSADFSLSFVRAFAIARLCWLGVLCFPRLCRSLLLSVVALPLRGRSVLCVCFISSSATHVTGDVFFCAQMMGWRSEERGRKRRADREASSGVCSFGGRRLVEESVGCGLSVVVAIASRLDNHHKRHPGQARRVY